MTSPQRRVKKNDNRICASFVMTAFLSFSICCSKPSALETNSATSEIPAVSSSNAAVESEKAVAHGLPSLVAISSGAYIVKRPSEWMDSESAYALLDENPKSKWASKRGEVTAQTIVIALPERTVLSTLEFDNASIDSQFKGASAKDLSVEVSDANENEGYQKIADISLADVLDNQSFKVSAEVPGRWVRLTVKNNHSTDTDSTIQLAEFRAFGKQLTTTPAKDVTGTYDVYFTGPLHLKQEGSSVSGCYESRQGIVKGGLEGHIVRLTWYEKVGYDVKEVGSGVLIFPGDGKQTIGVWWENISQTNTERILAGAKTSSDAGTCPQWAGGVEEQMLKDLAETGRTRVYGINFDTDSDKIKDESRSTLDKIANILKSKPDWKITIEGHTDSTSTPEHNKELSEKRAASVKAYLVAAGIDASRLTTAGYGSTKPVADNGTELGRAQNRRVELGKL